MDCSSSEYKGWVVVLVLGLVVLIVGAPVAM
jgi:hypothetical protein